MREASGLAVSATDPNLMWTINDSGGLPNIYLIATDGTYRGKATLAGAQNIDWEDLAAFQIDHKHYLIVADTGDNQAKRPFCTLHILQEPTLPRPRKTLDITIRSAWQIQYCYEEGPRDCEAVAVDAAAGKVILISKRTSPPEIYELPLHAPKKQGIQVARRVGKMTVICPVFSLVPFRDQPVGLDISAKNDLAAVVTYYSIFLFPRQPTETWAAAFARPPTVLPPHTLGQAESVAFSRDGKNIYTIAEGTESPIMHYQRR